MSTNKSKSVFEPLVFNQVYMVDVGDWDHLVETVYGKPYNFQQQDGCKERGIVSFTAPVVNPYDYPNTFGKEEINGVEMGVGFATWLARDPKEWNGDKSDGDLVHMFWERNFYPNIDMMINDLHAKGLIPDGDYLINIDW